MNFKKLNNYLIVLMLFAFSCKSTEQKSFDKLIHKLNITLSNEKQVILIIPLEGCHTCIEPVISFVSLTELPNNVQIIASTYNQQKYIDKAFSNNKDRIISDVGAYAIEIQLCSTAPVAYFLENGKIAEAVTLTPENTPEILQKIENLASDID